MNDDEERREGDKVDEVKVTTGQYKEDKVDREGIIM